MELNSVQKTNVKYLVEAAEIWGFTHRYAKAAILSVAFVESKLVPQVEMGYIFTPNDKLREIFGSRLPASDEELNELKKDTVAFFNAIYGGRFGNLSHEGYKYRGRGYNQITFKSNYAAITNIFREKGFDIDLVEKPDSLLNPQIAAHAFVAMLKREIEKHNANLSSFKPKLDLNKQDTLEDAVKRVYWLNVGRPRKYNITRKEALNKALKVSKFFLNLVDNIDDNKNEISAKEGSKKDFYGVITITIAFLGLLLFGFLIKLVYL